MSEQEVIARAVWGTDIGAGAPADVVSCGVPNWQLCLPDADAILSELDAAGRVVVERKTLAEAHAAMRACGWHQAMEGGAISDGVLEAACTEIEAAFAAMLSAKKEGGRD